MVEVELKEREISLEDKTIEAWLAAYRKVVETAAATPLIDNVDVSDKEPAGFRAEARAIVNNASAPVMAEVMTIEGLAPVAAPELSVRMEVVEVREEVAVVAVAPKVEEVSKPVQRVYSFEIFDENMPEAIEARIQARLAEERAAAEERDRIAVQEREKAATEEIERIAAQERERVAAEERARIAAEERAAAEHREKVAAEERQRAEEEYRAKIEAELRERALAEEIALAEARARALAEEELKLASKEIEVSNFATEVQQAVEQIVEQSNIQVEVAPTISTSQVVEEKAEASQASVVIADDISEVESVVAAPLVDPVKEMTLDEQIYHHIREALSIDYTSAAPWGMKSTEHPYQSVRLREHLVQGHRPYDDRWLSAVQLKGQTVLDLGSNLGEHARMAIRAGAERVEGYEADTWFAEIASAIDHYNNVSGISYRARDVSLASSYYNSFDVTLSFSMHGYTSSVISEIARVTNKVFIIETHPINPLTEGYKTYISEISKYFPHHRVLYRTGGFTGEAFEGVPSEVGERLVIAFAKDPKYFDPMEGIVKTAIDVSATHFPFDTSFKWMLAERKLADSKDLDAVLGSSSDLLPDYFTRHYESKLGYHPASYWLSMAAGYRHFIANDGTVTPDNPYINHMEHLLLNDSFDFSLAKEMFSRDRLEQVVLSRFKDMEKLELGNWQEVSPIRIYSPYRPQGVVGYYDLLEKSNFFAEKDEGVHRLFWARFFGVEKLYIAKSFRN